MKNIIIPVAPINASFYTFFNSTGKEINIHSPGKIMYLYSEFFASLIGSTDFMLNAYQSITLTPIINSIDNTIIYFADYNAIISGEQQSNLIPIVTYINITSSSNNYTINGTVSDFYIINSASMIGSIELSDNVPNFSIVKIYNLSTSVINITSPIFMYNIYYQPDGAKIYSLNPYSNYSFQLVKTTNDSIWIINSNNLQLYYPSFGYPYYITNFIGDYVTSTNSIYIAESIDGNIIIPSRTSNLSNIKIFNISTNSIYIKCADNATLLYNNFFAPAPDGVTTCTVPQNTTITLQFINVQNTQAQVQSQKKSGSLSQNSAFWTFTIG